MERHHEEYEGIYCQDDQHFHTGEKIQYLMIKQDKGTITKRLFCNKCFLGKYSSYQDYCCDIQELINGNIFEAFKYTKFDSNSKQMFFNYMKNLQPYIDEELIHNMIQQIKDEFESIINDLHEKLIEKVSEYKKQIQIQDFQNLVQAHFDCQDLKEALQNKEFQRSPKQFSELNQLAEKYVEQINKDNIDNRLKEKTELSLKNQTLFFNMDRYKNGLQSILDEIQLMQERIFSDYKYSQSSLSNPYIENVMKQISPDKSVELHKNLKSVFRLTEKGFQFSELQNLNNCYQTQNTLTIIQTKNKKVFGVYNSISQNQKSFLFHMNKEQYFKLKNNTKSFELNLQADLQTWLIKFGGGDIVINTNYKKCYSQLGTGFDIVGTTIFDNEEYLSDSKTFDISDMEIFAVIENEPQQPQPRLTSGVQQGQQPFLVAPQQPFLVAPQQPRIALGPPNFK